MTDSLHVEHQLSRLARVRDEDLAGLESSLVARMLLVELVAESDVPDVPARRRPARTLVLAAAVLVVLTMAVVIGPGLLGDGTGAASYANSAIEVQREGDYFVARIKDPLADRARFVEAFRAVGQDVEIELVPVSPRLAGQLLEERSGGGRYGEVHTEVIGAGTAPVDCARVPANCMIVIRIAVETTGWVRYKFGRTARPGEAYQDPSRGSGQPPSPNAENGVSDSGGSN